MADQKTDVEDFMKEIESGDSQPVAQPEPEIGREPESTRPVETEAPVTAPPPSAAPDPLAQALATIEELKASQTKLTERLEALDRPVTPTATREPEVETVEVLGYRVPKASDKRLVRVSAQDLVNLGWNDNPAAAIETLANVFIQHVANVLVKPAIEGARNEDQSRQTMLQQRAWFETEYSDLKEEAALLKTVEAGIMADPNWQKRSQVDHLREVAKAARTSIARWRGQTLEQYEAAIQSVKPTSTTTSRGRAVTSTSGARAPVAPATTDDKELADTVKDAIRR
jgi:hypothetical protein